MFGRIIRGATVGVGALVPFALAAIPAAVATAPAWAAEAARDTSGVVEEIVVTSRRRAESQQDVPVAVTAFRPEDIERIAPATLRDFDGLMPNVFIGMNTAGPSAGAIFIRGIGYADIEKTQSPAVGVVIDGVYQGSSTGQLIDAFDLQQLEVNRGPQGVLFGKNTTGGTIVANRSRPTGEWGVRVSAESGKYENDTYKLVANAPVIEDELALKVGATRHTMQGYVHNTTRGTDAGEIDYQAATVAALWTPIDNFEALLTYDRIEDTGDIPPQDPRYNGDNPHTTESDIQEAQKLFVNGLGL